MSQVLFLCTGNYYRSRFAEFYLRHLAFKDQVSLQTFSRGLAIDPYNPGPMATATREKCAELGVSIDPVREPVACSIQDLNRAKHVIAVKETEHRPMMKRKFPAWEAHIEYWEIHDLDVETPEQMFPKLIREVEELYRRLTGCAVNSTNC